VTFEFVPDSTIGCTGDGIGEAAAARLGGAPDASGAAPPFALHPTRTIATIAIAARPIVWGVYIGLAAAQSLDLARRDRPNELALQCLNIAALNHRLQFSAVQSEATRCLP
jgi:hypothetical protein